MAPTTRTRAGLLAALAVAAATPAMAHGGRHRARPALLRPARVGPRFCYPPPPVFRPLPPSVP